MYRIYKSSILILTIALSVLVFSCKSEKNNTQVLHSFNGSDGDTPKGTMTLYNNFLYGFTSSGGKNNKGVIFKIVSSGKEYEVLYNFEEGDNNALGNEPHHDAMLFYNNAFYGVTVYGGNNNNGVIFRINPDGSGYTPVHIFKGGIDDGAQPHSGVLEINGVFYGMTAEGGNEGKGVIYKMKPDGTDFSVLYSFHKSTGHNPHGRLTLGSDGHTVFGMTKTGGSGGFGVVFGFDISDSAYKTIHTFKKGKDDANTTEHGFLTLSNNRLYGSTHYGGEHDKGTIFSVNQDSTDFKIIHSFDDKSDEGYSPYGSLILYDGHLYGTTQEGGENKRGTIFRISTDGKKYETLMSYDKPTTGEYPIDNVVISSPGTELFCYGQEGGKFAETGKKKNGTIIKVDLNNPKK